MQNKKINFITLIGIIWIILILTGVCFTCINQSNTPSQAEANISEEIVVEKTPEEEIKASATSNDNSMNRTLLLISIFGFTGIILRSKNR